VQDGRITAVGRHSDLLAEVPAYRELLSSESKLAAAAEGGPR
jgi:ATP-binding cassette subfamily B protein